VPGAVTYWLTHPRVGVGAHPASLPVVTVQNVGQLGRVRVVGVEMVDPQADHGEHERGDGRGQGRDGRPQPRPLRFRFGLG